MGIRILAFFILLFSILFMPFWLSIILAIIGIIYFSFFWEAIILFFLSDLLYGIKEEKTFNVIFISLFTSFLIVIIIEYLKRKLKFYPKKD
ncbi:MAG: hypothetical protein WC662_01500 [Candidatus Paceibacterota bacterium]|jgi:hypothetical protein